MDCKGYNMGIARPINKMGTHKRSKFKKFIFGRLGFNTVIKDVMIMPKRARTKRATSKRLRRHLKELQTKEI